MQIEKSIYVDDNVYTCWICLFVAFYLHKDVVVDVVHVVIGEIHTDVTFVIGDIHTDDTFVIGDIYTDDTFVV